MIRERWSNGRVVFFWRPFARLLLIPSRLRTPSLVGSHKLRASTQMASSETRKPSRPYAFANPVYISALRCRGAAKASGPASNEDLKSINWTLRVARSMMVKWHDEGSWALVDTNLDPLRIIIVGRAAATSSWSALWRRFRSALWCQQRPSTCVMVSCSHPLQSTFALCVIMHCTF